MCFINIKNLLILSLLILISLAYTANAQNTFEKKIPKQPQNVLDQLNRYDVNFYKLDLNVSNTNCNINGSVTIISTAVSMLDTFYVELIDSVSNTTYMVVDSVYLNESRCAFTHNNSLIKIPVSSIQPGAKITTQVWYHGNGGPDVISYDLYLGEGFVNTLSEPQDAKGWFPCKQVLDDKADSTEMIITTESTNKAGSNGKLISATNQPDNKIRYIWKSNYPIAYYLISFAVGPYTEYDTYAKIDGLADSVFIQNYLFNGSPLLNQHKVAIEKIKLCMNLFSHLFGVYPFAGEKYGHCITGWPWGAMENQTMTTIGYEALDTTANLYAGVVYYFYSAHELAHSWFGDYVTCGKWNDLWLNEGFASYCEYIALQAIDSKINADKWINDAKTTAMSLPGGSVYYSDSLALLDDYRLSYKKGPLLLHMLRFEIGNDSVFYDIMKSYLIKYANKTALGLDFKAVLEEKTGRDFTDFFNQWYFGVGYPIFNIQLNQINDSLYITSKQTKSISTALLFKMHFMLQLKFAGGDTTLMLFQSQPTENFIIPFSRQVTSIVFDPGNWLLAKSTVKITGIEDNLQADVKSFRLSQNYPNPFNPETVIQYSIPEKSYVNLKLYDVLGREITTLVNEFKSSGDYSVKFNCKNLADGVYIYRLQAGNYDVSRKLIILK